MHGIYKYTQANPICGNPKTATIQKTSRGYWYHEAGLGSHFDELKKAIKFAKERLGDCIGGFVEEPAQPKFYLDHWDGAVRYLKDGEVEPRRVHYPQVYVSCSMFT